MSLQEFAKRLAKELKDNPTELQVSKTAEQILSFKLHGKLLSDAEIECVLQYMCKYLVDSRSNKWRYDNKEILILISEVKKLIEQAKEE